jgi:hypothetical protein
MGSHYYDPRPRPVIQTSCNSSRDSTCSLWLPITTHTTEAPDFVEGFMDDAELRTWVDSYIYIMAEDIISRFATVTPRLFFIQETAIALYDVDTTRKEASFD